MASIDVSFAQLTPERWSDFETLFGRRGACGGCWCMYWRLPRPQFTAQAGEDNRLNMYAIVHTGEAPGILAYIDRQPVGWCAIGPRETFPTLQRSRILKVIDDQPVWSVVCFFVARPYRRQGFTIRLLEAAVEFARLKGAKIIEGYPVEPREEKAPDVFVYTGLASAFRKAGFEEVARRSVTRPIMRKEV
jgi:GNAT superfamily N-acetyltransferase